MSSVSIHSNKNSHQRRPRQLALGLLFASALVMQSGCSYLEPYKSGVTQGNILTNESLGLLQQGLTKEQVRQLIGPPMGENPFNPNHWEYVFYSTNSSADLSEVKQHLIIEFDENQMVSQWKSKPIDVQTKVEDEKFLGLF